MQDSSRETFGYEEVFDFEMSKVFVETRKGGAGVKVNVLSQVERLLVLRGKPRGARTGDQRHGDRKTRQCFRMSHAVPLRELQSELQDLILRINRVA